MPLEVTEMISFIRRCLGKIPNEMYLAERLFESLASCEIKHFNKRAFIKAMERLWWIHITAWRELVLLQLTIVCLRFRKMV